MPPKRKAIDSSDDEFDDQGLKLRLERATEQKMLVVRRTQMDNLTQILYLLGSTGNVYQVKIGKNLECNCPDFERRKKHCKHILMVLSKVFNVDSTSRAYRKTELSPELVGDIFAKYGPDPSIMANDLVKGALEQEKEKEEEDSDSSDENPYRVCYACDSHIEKSEIPDTLVCYICHHILHQECFDNFNDHPTPTRLPCINCNSKIDTVTMRNSLQSKSNKKQRTCSDPEDGEKSQCSWCGNEISKEEFPSSLTCGSCEAMAHEFCLEMEYEHHAPYYPTKCPKCYSKVNERKMRRDRDKDYLNLGKMAGLPSKRAEYRRY